MRTARTIASDRVFKLAGGTEDNDLWVATVKPQDGGPALASCWVPSDEEREAIANGANVELIVWGEGTPPVAMRTTTLPLGRRRSEDELLEALGPTPERVLAELESRQLASRPAPARIVLSAALHLEDHLVTLFGIPIVFADDLELGEYRVEEEPPTVRVHVRWTASGPGGVDLEPTGPNFAGLAPEDLAAWSNIRHRGPDVYEVSPALADRLIRVIRCAEEGPR